MFKSIITFIVQVFIQLTILVLAALGSYCENFYIGVIFYVFACCGIDLYHYFLKKVEKEVEKEK